MAGETLAVFSGNEVEGKSVKEMKNSLAKQIGATRFQQRWFHDRQTVLEPFVSPHVSLVERPKWTKHQNDRSQEVCKKLRALQRVIVTFECH